MAVVGRICPQDRAMSLHLALDRSTNKGRNFLKSCARYFFYIRKNTMLSQAFTCFLPSSRHQPCAHAAIASIAKHNENQPTTPPPRAARATAAAPPPSAAAAAAFNSIQTNTIQISEDDYYLDIRWQIPSKFPMKNTIQISDDNYYPDFRLQLPSRFQITKNIWISDDKFQHPGRRAPKIVWKIASRWCIQLSFCLCW
jgi:hypothetical protein